MELCVPERERDAACGSDVSFGRDVCLRQVFGERITSFCRAAAIHLCAQHTQLVRQGIHHLERSKRNRILA